MLFQLLSSCKWLMDYSMLFSKQFPPNNSKTNAFQSCSSSIKTLSYSVLKSSVFSNLVFFYWSDITLDTTEPGPKNFAWFRLVIFEFYTNIFENSIFGRPLWPLDFSKYICPSLFDIWEPSLAAYLPIDAK